MSVKQEKMQKQNGKSCLQTSLAATNGHCKLFDNHDIVHSSLHLQTVSLTHGQRKVLDSCHASGHLSGVA